MITRFYVDNYKCLVNFEYKPKLMELIVGSNGSGKTTVFDAFGAIQDFVMNQKRAEEIFSPKNLTRWQSRQKMLFELEIDNDGQSFKYELLLDVDDEGIYCDVESEKLYEDKVLVVSAQYDNELITDEKDESKIDSFLKVNAIYMGREREFRVADITKSALGHYASDFRKALANVILLKMRPSGMKSETKKSQRRPMRSFSNFSDYYFHVLQEKQNLIFDLIPMLRDNVEGFRSFVLEERGPETRQLRVEFAVEGGKKGQTVRYDFTELSDGQRALIALYTLAFCESGSTLLIDEPENFISSRELQPWLMLLRERIEEFGGQAILISHHPEFINVLAPQDAIQFRRKDGGPVMIRPFETAPYQGLTPAEIVARGWENE